MFQRFRDLKKVEKHWMGKDTLYLSFIIVAVLALEVDVRMPGIPAVPGVDEIYLCTSVPLPEPEQTLYATSFHPKATKNFVHHFVVYACSEPPFPSDGSKSFINKIFILFTK